LKINSGAVSFYSMYRRRLLTEKLLQLHHSFPIVAVVGARQVGKSTLLGEVFRGADSVLFDPLQDVENARTDPDLFLRSHRTPLILDEVQYAPEVVAALKRRIDQDRRPGQYLLSGSQQWSVMRNMAESLAGRVAFLDLEGFCLDELRPEPPARSWLADFLDHPDQALSGRGPGTRQATPVAEQLWRGFLPEAQELPRAVVPGFFQAYQRTYIERDVRQLGEVSDWQLFGRFFRLAAALTACELNHSQLGRELGLNPQTARRWLALLEATFQWFELPALARNAVKRVSQRPKGHLADTGLACAAQAISSPEALSGHPLWGALFESAVVAEVRKLSAALPTPPRLYHFRVHGGTEVDLVLERDGTYFPIEVKAHSRPTPGDAAGLHAFRRAFPDARVAPGLIICPGEQVLRLAEDAWAVPWDW